MLIPFYCPTHGEVLSTVPVARVQCRCGRECAPEGVTPAQQVKRYSAVMRGRRKAKRATL